MGSTALVAIQQPSVLDSDPEHRAQRTRRGTNGTDVVAFHPECHASLQVTHLDCCPEEFIRAALGIFISDLCFHPGVIPIGEGWRLGHSGVVLIDTPGQNRFANPPTTVQGSNLWNK